MKLSSVPPILKHGGGGGGGAAERGHFSPSLPFFYTRAPLSNSIRSSIQGPQKKLLTESYWSHVAQAQSHVAGNPCVSKNVFWSFLSKTKHDQVMSRGNLDPQHSILPGIFLC